MTTERPQPDVDPDDLPEGDDADPDAPPPDEGGPEDDPADAGDDELQNEPVHVDDQVPTGPPADPPLHEAQ